MNKTEALKKLTDWLASTHMTEDDKQMMTFGILDVKYEEALKIIQEEIGVDHKTAFVSLMNSCKQTAFNEQDYEDLATLAFANEYLSE